MQNSGLGCKHYTRQEVVESNKHNKGYSAAFNVAAKSFLVGPVEGSTYWAVLKDEAPCFDRKH
jgi:hypothetical protein